MASRLGPAPKATSAAVSRSMRANKAKDTGPELELRRLLRAHGLSGYKTAWKHAPGRPDVVFPSAHLAVFLNGCYWHRCPHCRLPLPKSNRAFWRKKFKLNKERDRRKTRELRKLGWTVLTAWECYLKKRPRLLESLLSDIHASARPSVLRDA